MERPFIIHNLRRTGGTSLSAFMAAISGFPAVEDEPFNQGRLWWRFTREVQQGLAGDELRGRLRELLKQRPNLKHCVEMVPMSLTLALIDICQSLGYQQFVLQRTNEKARLLSLHLALSTGAWTAEDVQEMFPALRSGEVKAKTIQVAKLARQAQSGYARLGQTLMTLRAKQIDFTWLVFEEIYTSTEAKAAVGLSVARNLGIELAEDDPRLEAFVQHRGQGSAEALKLVPNADKLLAELDRLFG